MESLTNFKVKKNGTNYNSILSPENIGQNKQIESLVEKNGKLYYNTVDGEKEIDKDKIEENVVLATWNALTDKEPYTFSATETLTNELDTNTVVELINNNPVLFAKYGFVIGEITGQNITFYAIEEPTESVTLNLVIGGY